MNWKKDVEDFKKGLTVEASKMSVQAIRFGFFGSVGGGKSCTAGIFAVGITPEGLIGWIDGEGRRSGYAIDVVAEMGVKKYGGTKQSWIARFKVIHIDPPFHPLRVVACIEAFEEMGCKTVICDIMSQAWDSDGGYLDLKADEVDKMVSANRTTTEQRVASSAAAHVKPFTHQKLVNKVNVSKCNLVLLFQAKAKFNAKTSKPDDFVTPIQESGLTRTALAVGRVECQMLNGSPCGGFCTFAGEIDKGTKYTHPALLAILPKNGEQFKFEHGEGVLRWVMASQGSAPATITPPTSEDRATKQNASDGILGANPPSKSVRELELELWAVLKPIRTPSKKGWDEVNQWLWAEEILDPAKEPAEQMPGLSADKLVQVIAKCRKIWTAKS